MTQEAILAAFAQAVAPIQAQLAIVNAELAALKAKFEEKPIPTDRLLLPAEACAVLKCHINTLHRWSRFGWLKTKVVRVGHGYRYRLEDLTARRGGA